MSDAEAKGMGELWAGAKQIEGEESLEQERNEKRKKGGQKGVREQEERR